MSTTPVVAVRIPAALLERLDALPSDVRTTRSAHVREAIGRYLRDEEAPKAPRKEER